jgi:hypothetical protein
MKKMLFLSLLALTAITACKKDSLGTKPVITFKSYSSSPINASNGVNITFQLKDGDGDVQNTLSFAIVADATPEDTNTYTTRRMPDLEQNNGISLTADMILRMQSIDLANPNPNILKDSIYFRVYIVDNKSNHSDTIFTPKVEILYQ